jgi:KDO2-lipid IV(A) lauroyltransferase
MRLFDFATSPRTIRFGVFASRFVPRSIGYRLSRWVSGLISRLKPEVFRILCTNVAQVLGPGVEPETVQAAARRVIFHFLHGYYDLFRSLRQPYDEVLSRVSVSDRLLSTIASCAEQGRGLILVLAHVGNFDLAGQVVSHYVPQLQVITLANPPAGFVSLNELRTRGGSEVTPLSAAALRRAIRVLREGGTVVVAGDRPVSDLDEPVPFFGRPARVPSGHVRLALRTGAALAVTYCAASPETGGYVVDGEPILELVRTGDRRQDLELNMERVLESLEDVVRCWVDQWMMFVPVWPDLFEAEEPGCVP